MIIIEIKDMTASLENPEKSCSGGKSLVIPIITNTSTATTSDLKIREKNKKAVNIKIINDNRIFMFIVDSCSSKADPLCLLY
jgi:hypothetical protein